MPPSLRGSGRVRTPAEPFGQIGTVHRSEDTGRARRTAGVLVALEVVVVRPGQATGGSTACSGAPCAKLLMFSRVVAAMLVSASAVKNAW